MAFRLVKQAPNGKVDEIFTMGAPGPFQQAPSSECLPGLRVITAWGRTEWWAPSMIDAVPSLTQAVGLRHFMMDIGQVDLRYGNFSLTPCSNATARDPSNGTASIPIHKTARYEEGYAYLPERAAKMSRFARIAYEADTGKVRRAAWRYNYGLVATVLSETDRTQISHLLQNPFTMECTLTFHGTEDTMDWVTNFQASWTDFCGLSTRVHWGFRWQLRRMVQNAGFQRDIRPKLPFCKKLTVVGHSMGGAVGELLAACLQRVPRGGEEDYQHIGFRLQTPKVLDYL